MIIVIILHHLFLFLSPFAVCPCSRYVFTRHSDGYSCILFSFALSPLFFSLCFFFLCEKGNEHPSCYDSRFLCSILAMAFLSDTASDIFIVRTFWYKRAEKRKKRTQRRKSHTHTWKEKAQGWTVTSFSLHQREGGREKRKMGEREIRSCKAKARRKAREREEGRMRHWNVTACLCELLLNCMTGRKEELSLNPKEVKMGGFNF